MKTLFWLMSLATCCMVAGVARAEEPAKPQPHNTAEAPRHFATLVVAGVGAVNGGPTGGGLIGLCYENEREVLSAEVCSAFSVDNHLTLTGEISAAMFRRWSRAALGGGVVVMGEYAHEGFFVGVAPTINLVIPLHHVVDIAAEVGGGPQWLVAATKSSELPVGSARLVGFTMVGLVIKLNP